ncbi:hypothetical protein RQM47_05415 [Rubrivirga sp. S365]|uniref:Uncharacterized protein n=1 Tax=Rubrivirga litoralis TaxID=3075598 RepID=A0ABU3BR51_9BACT|nr:MULTISPECIES: hypothetical protein [unclassified Rubrivirga]MDT0631762.1 hypothetical protein [Rubrivirga sp. F394]MDT7856073.1 hypothetical protein [Rubrivirga sp. S365]
MSVQWKATSAGASGLGGTAPDKVPTLSTMPMPADATPVRHPSFAPPRKNAASGSTTSHTMAPDRVPPSNRATTVTDAAVNAIKLGASQRSPNRRSPNGNPTLTVIIPSRA